MGIYSSLPLWASAVGGLSGGALNDILARRWGLRFARRAVGLSGKLLGAALIGFSLQLEDGRSAMVVVAAAKFFSDFSQPTVWGTVTDIAGRASGRVFGLVNTAGSLGGFLAGPVLGAIKQDYGWPALFWTIGWAYVLSGLAWLVIDPTRKLVLDAPKE
jgi:ACS family glucarate transporter-like MFS transporter